MYFRILKNVIFRRYNDYGYITDNSMFGYRFFNDKRFFPGERFISESGSYMIDILSKQPKHIDDIINELLTIFEGVGFDELKTDTFNFYMQFVNEGFLAFGRTEEECINYEVSEEIIKTFANAQHNSEDKKNITLDNNDFLRSLHIEIVNECNERCVHCYIPHDQKNKILASDLFLKILEEGRKLNIIHITISGGEPLLHKDLIPFLRKCRELDLSVNVLSNLALLNDTIIEEMKKNPLLSVQTSIYSMNPAVHDSITHKSGSFELTKSAVLKLIKAGIPVQISCPIMKENKNDFATVKEWGESNNIFVLFNYVIFAAYDHSNCNLSHRLSLDEVENAFESQLCIEYVNSLRENAFQKESLTQEDSICSICKHFFCISAEGDVYPCAGWQTKVVGNIKNNSIKELWEDSIELNRLRSIKWKHFPKCVACKNRGYCTVCMMSNANESPDGDIFKINEFHCQVAHMKQEKVKNFYLNNRC